MLDDAVLHGRDAVQHVEQAGQGRAMYGGGDLLPLLLLLVLGIAAASTASAGLVAPDAGRVDVLEEHEAARLDGGEDALQLGVVGDVGQRQDAEGLVGEAGDGHGEARLARARRAPEHVAALVGDGEVAVELLGQGVEEGLEVGGEARLGLLVEVDAVQGPLGLVPVRPRAASQGEGVHRDVRLLPLLAVAEVAGEEAVHLWDGEG